VALREAEGERERAKAWAANEKEMVKKWADEQRALIKKDRHKAANVALLASKKAAEEEEQRRMRRQSHEGDHEGTTKAELRAAIEKMKTDAEETRRLREQIRRQEQMISALKNERASSAAVPGLRTSRSPASGGTSAVVVKKITKSSGKVGARQALGDRSSMQNANQQHAKPKPLRARNVNEGSPSVPKKPQQPKEAMMSEQCSVLTSEGEEAEMGTLTEEPPGHWLQHQLSKLSKANDRLGAKIIHEVADDPCNVKQEGVRREEDGEYGEGEKRRHQREYNAADYSSVSNDHGGKEGTAFPNQSLSRSSQSDPVPPFVTAPSPSFRALQDVADRQQELARSQTFTYKNGTQKEILPNGTTTISFANGDRKRTYANEKQGITVYYYASTKTTQVTHQDGMKTYHFPNKQIENHYTDGRKEINFPDGTVRMVHTDGSCDTTFADGVRVIDFPDGTQEVIREQQGTV